MRTTACTLALGLLIASSGASAQFVLQAPFPVADLAYGIQPDLDVAPDGGWVLSLALGRYESAVLDPLGEAPRLTVADSLDWGVLARYDADGRLRFDVPLPGVDPSAVAATADGGVWLAGSTLEATDLDPHGGGRPFAPAPGEERAGFVARYDAAGHLMGLVHLGPFGVGPSALAALPDGGAVAVFSVPPDFRPDPATGGAWYTAEVVNWGIDSLVVTRWTASAAPVWSRRLGVGQEGAVAVVGELLAVAAGVEGEVALGPGFALSAGIAPWPAEDTTPEGLLLATFDLDGTPRRVRMLQAGGVSNQVTPVALVPSPDGLLLGGWGMGPYRPDPRAEGPAEAGVELEGAFLVTWHGDGTLGRTWQPGPADRAFAYGAAHGGVLLAGTEPLGPDAPLVSKRPHVYRLQGTALQQLLVPPADASGVGRTSAVAALPDGGFLLAGADVEALDLDPLCGGHVLAGYGGFFVARYDARGCLAP